MSVPNTTLGVDIGASRVRVASGVREAGGIRVRAVAARDLPSVCVADDGAAQPELVAAVIEDLVAEVGGMQRRCVLSLGVLDARVRFVRFPTMPYRERRRAAQFEAERMSDWDANVETVTRMHPVDSDGAVQAIGIARRDAIAFKIACARRSGLRPVAVDSDALAYRRAFPSYDATLDVGHAHTTLHLLFGEEPASIPIAGGGAAVTRALAADLSIDAVSAEKRKRMLGTAGAGEAALDEFVSGVSRAVAIVRQRAVVRRIAVAGNGIRLAGLVDALERAIDASVEVPVSALFAADAYPGDVLRAAAPDWTLAGALATWGFA